MKEKLKIFFILAAFVFVVDQYTKWLVVQNISYGHHIVVWENFFDLVHYRNKGAAFGILSTWDSPYRDIFFYVLSAIAVVFLFYYLKQVPNDKKWGAVPIGLIFGGALGNICDRIFRGSVVDFLSVHWYDRALEFTIFGKQIYLSLVWPAFNVADSAISTSVVCLLVMMAFEKPESAS